MKTIILRHNQKAFIVVCFFICCIGNGKAQTFTPSINIGSINQTLNQADFNSWLVTNMSVLMQTAPAYPGNTVAPPAGNSPIFTQVPLQPVGINQSAFPVQANIIVNGQNYTELSCYNTNTIYTQPVAVNTYGNYTMVATRRFTICSSNNEQINFDFFVKCDDGITNVYLDGNTANTLFAQAAPSPAIVPIHVVGTRILAPGQHTIDIQCYDWQNPAGQMVTIPANLPNAGTWQWNPFAVAIAGSISSANNGAVLLNGTVPVVSPITGGPTNFCAGGTANFSNATPGGIWASSNPNIVTITQAGLVTGIAPGSATITYTITNGQCTNVATLPITVTNCHCEDSCNWSLTGNSNVRPWNFIGSLNSADFNIRTANTHRMVVTATGNVGINIPTLSIPAPAKLLDVNGEVRVRSLPFSGMNNSVVFANSFGDLLALPASPSPDDYLSGNGTWKPLPPSGGLTNADQGLTIDEYNPNTVVLGDRCGVDNRLPSGLFTEARQINMNDQNLYFNAYNTGKLYMGTTLTQPRGVCRELQSRLEISTVGLPDAKNEYSSPYPSTSGLRFTDLTAKSDPIPNKYKGVLSLDEDGDVIWVTTCCDGGVDPQLKGILDRLTKLENEVKESKAQAAALKEQLTQMDILLAKTNTVVLNQNVPNPFAESTVITYSIPDNFSKAQIIFKTLNGEVIKTADIKTAGKGQVNVFANDISGGVYTYTLVIDGKQIETKKMVKQ